MAWLTTNGTPQHEGVLFDATQTLAMEEGREVPLTDSQGPTLPASSLDGDNNTGSIRGGPSRGVPPSGGIRSGDSDADTLVGEERSSNPWNSDNGVNSSSRRRASCDNEVNGGSSITSNMSGRSTPDTVDELSQEQKNSPAATGPVTKPATVQDRMPITPPPASVAPGPSRNGITFGPGVLAANGSGNTITNGVLAGATARDYPFMALISQVNYPILCGFFNQLYKFERRCIPENRVLFVFFQVLMLLMVVLGLFLGLAANIMVAIFITLGRAIWGDERFQRIQGRLLPQ